MIALSALVLAFGAAAYAAIPDSGGVIHGCYGGSSSLRVIDSERGDVCRANETPLTFNQTGPQGPPGQDGADGQDGQDGLDGLDGLDAADGASGADAPLEPRGAGEAVSAPDGPVSAWGPRFAAQRSVKLPAGNWVVTATAVANTTKPGAATFDCRLRAGGKVVDSIDHVALAAGGTTGEREAFTLTGATRLASAGRAELQCRSATPGNVRTASITAIGVERIAGGS